MVTLPFPCPEHKGIFPLIFMWENGGSPEGKIYIQFSLSLDLQEFLTLRLVLIQSLEIYQKSPFKCSYQLPAPIVLLQSKLTVAAILSIFLSLQTFGWLLGPVASVL